MSSRAAKIERQLERIARTFTKHPQGLSKGRLTQLTEIPGTSVSGLMARLRHRVDDFERVAACLFIGGEWIYGWAETMHQHQEEHYKRRRNERRSLVLSRKLLEQSIQEQPEAMNLRHQLVGVKNRIAEVDLAIYECSQALGHLRAEIDRAA